MAGVILLLHPPSGASYHTSFGPPNGSDLWFREMGPLMAIFLGNLGVLVKYDEPFGQNMFCEMAPHFIIQ